MLPFAAYNALLLVAGLLAAPVAALACLLRPAWRRGLAARLGLGWPRLDGEVLWAHAASVGEIEGIAPLVRGWSDAHPRGTVLLTSLTATGCDAARRLVPGALVRTFPLDLPWLADAVVRRVRPSLFLFSENEVWPNTIAALGRSGVPVVQVSGRLSERAARTLARFPRIAREVLGRVDRFCVQAPEHRDRLLALGVRPERIVVTGSLKGVERSAVPAHFVAGIAATGRPVIVAGSTHAGEESALLDAQARFAADRLPLLVLAPRHPERFAQVAGLLERQGGPWLRRSALRAGASEAELAAALRGARVLLLDTLGELAGCYAAADVAFVGGTLVPIGGHNVLEAARAGVPVVVGPHHANVARLVDRLVAAGAGAVAASSAELHPALARLLDPATAGPARAAARAVAAGETGGLEATWAALASLADLPQPPGAEGRPGAARAAAAAPGAHPA